MLKDIHQMFAHYPLLDSLFQLLVNAFLAPGEFLLRSLAATPWGHEWHVTATWPATAFIALLFWCVAFNLLLTANESVKRILNRDNHDDEVDNRQDDLDRARGKKI